MKKIAKNQTKDTDLASYYDGHGILDELVEDAATLSLSEELRAAVLGGDRRHNLQSITLKLDPVQVQAIKKLATMKSMPYQTLIRTWLAAELKKELHLAVA
jgi:predicted DNA binding CopG/RHH family protein